MPASIVIESQKGHSTFPSAVAFFRAKKWADPADRSVQLER